MSGGTRTRTRASRATQTVETIPFQRFLTLAGQSEERTGLALAAGALDYGGVLRGANDKLRVLPVGLPWLLLMIELIDRMALGEMTLPTVRASLDAFRGWMAPAWRTALQSQEVPAVYLTKPDDPTFRIELSFMSHAVSLWRAAQTAQTA